MVMVMVVVMVTVIAMALGWGCWERTSARMAYEQPSPTSRKFIDENAGELGVVATGPDVHPDGHGGDEKYAG